jgi:hypothetical protein
MNLLFEMKPNFVLQTDERTVSNFANLITVLLKKSLFQTVPVYINETRNKSDYLFI